ncbi:MAG: hypothetical protein ABFD44_12945 [Anaerolineaceae bacterium]
MPRTEWFDPESSAMLFSAYAEKMESWQKAMEDGVITADELDHQAQKLADLLRELEPELTDEIHAQVTQILMELAVYYGMQHEAILHDFGADE